MAGVHAMLLGAAGAFAFTKVIAADTSNYDLRADALAAGWNGVSPLKATITVNAGVVLSANSTGAFAFSTGTSYPSGSALALINNGYIIGMGGAGGYVNGAGNLVAASAGGPALLAQAAITITNNGAIGGGGGGGGGGSGSQGSAGGGGGRTGRTASAAGSAGPFPTGSGAANGSFDQGGAGGGWTPGAGGTTGPGASSSDTWGSGGGGGGWGSAGGSGKGASAPLDGAGAAGGAAITGNANITWATTGALYGAIT